MILHLPIEPLEERYTEQWWRWFPEEFKRQDRPYVSITGESLTDKVETGTFLDINSTMYWKACQIREIANLFHDGSVKDGDVFFASDAEMFGMEATIRYLIQLNGIDAKFYGFAHAGSYTREDVVAPCEPFAKHLERAWGTIYDEIFVGTSYHKDQLCRLRGVHPEIVTVTGNPYQIEEVRESISREPKKRRVIHTNRPDPEKRPIETLDTFHRLKQKYPDWEFMVTTSRDQWGTGEIRNAALQYEDRGIITIQEGLSKYKYFQLLQESTVMTGNSVEENFGYCILEALIFGTVPVVPVGLSHTEILKDPRMLFHSQKEQMTLIENAMAGLFEGDSEGDVEDYLLSKAKRYEGSLFEIVRRLV